jgi:hypothetical protein
MKKGTLILIGMFLMISTIEAKTYQELSNRIEIDYAYNNAVNFVERGIEFFIFTNGDFDFNIHQNNSYYDYNGFRIKNNNHVRIDRDYRGRITRIENVFINYDFRGNVSRVGSVFIGYQGDRLIKVGELRIRYNNYGYPVFYGNVRDYYYHNGARFQINFGDVCDYNDAYFYRNDFSRNYSQIREDANFYYFKANANAKIGKRSTILKRRKPATNIDRNRDIKRDFNNSYRKPSNDKRENETQDSRRNSDIKIDRNNGNRSSSNATYRKPSNDKKAEVITASKRNPNYSNGRNNSNKKIDKNSRKEENNKKRRN